MAGSWSLGSRATQRNIRKPSLSRSRYSGWESAGCWKHLRGSINLLILAVFNVPRRRAWAHHQGASGRGWHWLQPGLVLNLGSKTLRLGHSVWAWLISCLRSYFLHRADELEPISSYALSFLFGGLKRFMAKALECCWPWPGKTATGRCVEGELCGDSSRFRPNMLFLWSSGAVCSGLVPSPRCQKEKNITDAF